MGWYAVSMPLCGECRPQEWMKIVVKFDVSRWKNGMVCCQYAPCGECRPQEQVKIGAETDVSQPVK